MLLSLSPTNVNVEEKMIKYTIGCDPELFLMDQAGKFVSAHDYLPGSKFAPFPVQSGAVQVDGVSAEFNINPADNVEDFLANIKTVLIEMTNKVHEKAPDLSLRVIPTAVFDKDYFSTLPPEALVFGCDPDYNAYTHKVQEFKPTEEPFRTGAGHIHIGWIDGNVDQDPLDESHFFDCCQTVKGLDTVLYPMSLLWDDDTKRRTLYGKIGSFRPKKYGVEYRPLSNAFIADPDLQRWVFNATCRTMKLLDDDYKLWSWRYPIFVTNRVLNDEPLTRAELLHYHDFLVGEWNIDPLPEDYLKAA
jgi:hypothetical protein